jgi:hypothetical protein
MLREAHAGLLRWCGAASPGGYHQAAALAAALRRDGGHEAELQELASAVACAVARGVAPTWRNWKCFRLLACF